MTADFIRTLQSLVDEVMPDLTVGPIEGESFRVLITSDGDTPCVSGVAELLHDLADAFAHVEESA